MENKSSKVAILGASNKPDRYSYKAQMLLKKNGHQVFPVHPKLEIIEGEPVYSSLGEIPEPIDTLTLYVGPARLEPLIPEIVKLKPGRVIMNPGTESDALKKALDEAGIPWLEACTLVLLNTRQF